MEYLDEKETGLRDYVRVVFKHKVIILLCFIVIMPMVYFKQEMKTPYFTSRVKMMISGVMLSDSEFYKTLPVAGRFVTSSTMKLVTSKLVVDRVVEALKLYERNIDYDEMANASKLRRYLIKDKFEKMEREIYAMSPERKKEMLFNRAARNLTRSISISQIEDTNLFYITVKDYNSQLAPLIANSLSRSFVIFDLEKKIVELKLKYGEKHTSIMQLEGYIAELYKTLDGKMIPDLEAMGPASVKIIGQARSMSYEGMINKERGLILGFFISLFLGVALSFIMDLLNQTYKTAHDIEKHLKMPFLGSIPKMKFKKEALCNTLENNKYTKYYQNISNRLNPVIMDNKIHSILIANPDDSKDTATVVANVSLYLAQTKVNYRVLIIDADFRSHHVSNSYNMLEKAGLLDVLDKRISFEDAVNEVHPNVYVLSVGHIDENALMNLYSPQMTELVNRVKDRYDMVFVTCADMKKYNDAVVLSPMTDGVALILNEGKVRRFMLKMAIEPMEKNNVFFVGAILNNRKMVIPKIIYNRI